jgi:hypothetical protein
MPAIHSGAVVLKTKLHLVYVLPFAGRNLEDDNDDNNKVEENNDEDTDNKNNKDNNSNKFNNNKIKYDENHSINNNDKDNIMPPKLNPAPLLPKKATKKRTQSEENHQRHLQAQNHHTPLQALLYDDPGYVHGKALYSKVRCFCWCPYSRCRPATRACIQQGQIE